VKYCTNEPILYNFVRCSLQAGKKKVNLSTDRFSLLSCTYIYTGYRSYCPPRVDMRRRTSPPIFTYRRHWFGLPEFPMFGGHLRFRSRFRAGRRATSISSGCLQGCPITFLIAMPASRKASFFTCALLFILRICQSSLRDRLSQLLLTE